LPDDGSQSVGTTAQRVVVGSAAHYTLVHVVGGKTTDSLSATRIDGLLSVARLLARRPVVLVVHNFYRCSAIHKHDFCC